MPNAKRAADNTGAASKIRATKKQKLSRRKGKDKILHVAEVPQQLSSDVPSVDEDSAADEEEEEDLGIDSASVKLTSILKDAENASKARKSWAEKFSALITTDQDKVLVKLDEASKKMQNDKETFEGVLLPVLASALAGSTLNDEQTETIVPIQINPNKSSALEEYTGNVFNNCRALLESYTSIVKQQQQQSHQQNDALGNSSMSTFRKVHNIDKEKALAAVEAGRKVAGMEVQRMLDGVDAAGGSKHVSEFNLKKEDMEMGRLVLKHGKQQRQNGSENTNEKQGGKAVGWGNLVFEMNRAVEWMQNLTR